MLVTHGFLRSLADHELEVSAVGRFARPGERPVNVGDTPWAVVIVAGGGRGRGGRARGPRYP